MIFVILGTQDKEFPRLLKSVEKEIEKGNIKEEVIVQAGCTKYKSDRMKIFDLVSMDEFNNYLTEADLVITHGGYGTITNALNFGKKIIACPRLKKYKEHTNDHQKEILEAYEKEGYILYMRDENDLGELLNKVKSFKPKKYEDNSKNIIKIVTDFIDKN